MPPPITSLKTPGVYVYELDSFPPSIAQVATAIPVFIGYTAMAQKKGVDVTNQAVRISSLVQYTQYFGGDFPNLKAIVALNNDNSVNAVDIRPRYQLFNALKMFYANGGSDCYIISVGPYKNDGSAKVLDFIEAGKIKCFEVLRKEDEPTLIVIPDAVLLGQTDFNAVMQTSLQLCADLQDRFTILDVLNGDKDRTYDNLDVITQFRTGVGANNLNYGAAYYPWLRSGLPYSFSYRQVQLQKPAGTNINVKDVVSNNDAVTQIDRAIDDADNIITKFIKTPAAPLTKPITDEYGLIPVTGNQAELSARITYIQNLLLGFLGLTAFKDINPGGMYPGLTTKQIFDNTIRKGTSAADISPVEKILREWLLINTSYPIGGGLAIATPALFATYNLAGVAADTSIYGNPVPVADTVAVPNIRSRVDQLYASALALILSFGDEVQQRIASLELQLTASSAIYAAITTAIQNKGIIVPPSGAVAGVYATVDGTRGVWKAPANISLVNVIEPLVTINDKMQEDLNIDTNAGKSVNAIRTFTGKGVLVWGARTLQGNSADWRYISVRRLYIMVEESVKKACMQFVFEPNDANTWVKVRAMIENYLTNLWRDGALAGPKPAAAFYVKIGLGQTMTMDDILDGRMIVEIAMAPVRPAEFIILRFSQTQQQA